MSNHDLGALEVVATSIAGAIALACAAAGGAVGAVTAAWIGVTAISTWRGRPDLGLTALGLAGLYGLAALASLGGSDAEDVDHEHTNLRLAGIAIGCAVVGVMALALSIRAHHRARR